MFFSQEVGMRLWDVINGGEVARSTRVMGDSQELLLAWVGVKHHPLIVGNCWRDFELSNGSLCWSTWRRNKI